MEFNVHTNYDRRAMTAMSRAMRKTVRKKRNRLTRLWAGAVLLLSILCLLPLDGTFTWSGSTIVNGLVALLMLVTLTLEDPIDGWFAHRCLLPGAEEVDATFTQDCYRTKSSISTTKWDYGTICAIVESPRYFVLILSKRHAQIYDKSALTGGSSEQLRTLLETMTGKHVVRLKR